MQNFKKIKLDDINFKCISLPKRTDRRDWVKSHLKSFNIPFEFFDGLTPSDNYDNLSFLENSKPGGIGGTLSHYELIKNYNGSIYEDTIIFDKIILSKKIFFFSQLKKKQ